MSSLKDIVTKKDEEIGRLRLLKLNGDGERRRISSPRHESASPSPRRHSIGEVRPSQRISGQKSPSEKAASDLDNSSEYNSDKHSDAGSQQSIDDHKEFFRQSRLAILGGDKLSANVGSKFNAVADGSKNPNNDVELLGFGEDDSDERLSDISDGVLSMGTETDGSINSIVEYTLFPEKAKPSTERTEK